MNKKKIILYILSGIVSVSVLVALLLGLLIKTTFNNSPGTTTTPVKKDIVKKEFLLWRWLLFTGKVLLSTSP